MAIHRITSAVNDFYTGPFGLSENQLQTFLPVLSNDPRGATLWSISASVPHALGGSQTTTPQRLTIVDNGITYTGFASRSGGQIKLDFSQSSVLIGALGNGDLLTGSFYYVDRLATGRFSSAKVTFTIRGINDTATISGTSTGSVTEDGTSAAVGMLTVTDPDAGENRFQTGSFVDITTYGTFSFDSATGGWRFDLNNASPDVQALDAGDQVDVGFLVTSLDGSATQLMNVTINGAEDGAVITGDDYGYVAEDGTLTDGGTLSVTDLDAGEAGFQTPTAGDLAGTYGDFTFNPATGAWGYTLRNGDANVQALIASDIVSDYLTVNSLDGTEKQITVEIQGKNDTAQILGNAISGDVYEDGTATTGGTLSVSDPDAGQDKFKPLAGSGVLTYGTFTFDEVTGEWEFTINNTAAQALVTDEFFSQGITVESLDGSDTQTITVKVHGLNDIPVLGGDTQGVVHDDGVSGSETAGGTVSVTDPDAGQNVFESAALLDLAGDYGTFTFNASTGAWTYDLDSDNVDVNNLGDEGQLFDFLHPVAKDGTVLEIMVTIFGHA
jgi:VCBS repeat-containing protein